MITRNINSVFRERGIFLHVWFSYKILCRLKATYEIVVRVGNNILSTRVYLIFSRKHAWMCTEYWKYWKKPNDLKKYISLLLNTLVLPLDETAFVEHCTATVLDWLGFLGLEAVLNPTSIVHYFYSCFITGFARDLFHRSRNKFSARVPSNSNKTVEQFTLIPSRYTQSAFKPFFHQTFKKNGKYQ